MSDVEGFVAPEMIVEGKAIARAVMSLPMPDISTMSRTEREVCAWIEYKRQMGALRIANLLRWGIKPQKPTRRRGSGLTTNMYGVPL